MTLPQDITQVCNPKMSRRRTRALEGRFLFEGIPARGIGVSQR